MCSSKKASTHTRRSRVKCFRKNLTHLVPADTWHQPEYTNKSETRKAYIECNHKCDKPIADMTCAIDELSLRGTEVMCEHTVIDVDLELKAGTTLGKVRRDLLNIKPFVGHLKLRMCYGFKTAADEDGVGKGDFQRRLMEIVGMNAAGPKLQELTIRGIGGVSKALLNSLAPTLKPLKTLTIDTDCCHILYLMHTFCPNLVTFHLLGREWQEDAENINIQSWPTLTRLVLKGVPLNVDSDTDDGKRFRRFIKLNPQLDSLEVDFMVDNSLLKVIAKGLRDLKLLTIGRDTFEGIGAIFNHLVRLKRLQTIMVTTWIFKTCHFKSLLACVECFSKMKRLELSTLQQTYSREEKKVVVIEDFPVTYHSNCNCHGQDSRVLTFGDHTDPITLPKNKRTLTILISVAGDLKSADDTLEARIFTMFKAAKKFYPNVHKSTVIQEDERFVFLHVASTL
ncbi:uncharacterized protein LOC129579912 [Sitodiplosis mosellana]|uniref:uncharacterized protein LOC129579912 n=1 Tax=Sitodiplosis mosellana TaxID=263140 RepID=UPI002443FD52|nr:uncharacterized protein LOC129579912 [Sitodiplosis mosellana]